VWKKYRRLVAVLQALVIIGLPFLKIKGESALRFDLTSLKLHFFGAVIWINEFYLVLIGVIFLLLLIVTVTNVLGRVWCGWLCPQTVLLDLAGDLARVLTRGNKSVAVKLVLLPLSALVSLTLIWYFVPPSETMRGLFSSKLILGFFLAQWAVVYAGLAFLGRTFCKTVCPYSMLQSGLFDGNTLVIAFDPGKKEECKGCDKCVRVCPVGIDIKDGIRRECIACAECIDACSSMVKSRGIPPLINYRGTILRQKALVLSGVTLLSGLALVVLVTAMPAVDFVITRNPVQLLRGVNSYTYSIRNNKDSILRGDLSVKGDFSLIGEKSVKLKPYEMVHGGIIAKANGRSPADIIVFVLRVDGRALERKVGFL
jgi:cytochrome c oxidase accessory protein FixG